MLVALRKESVDRNHIYASSGVDFAVALRKESVDRNLLPFGLFSFDVVALRKESVDRNQTPPIISFRWYRRSPQGERG